MSPGDKTYRSLISSWFKPGEFGRVIFLHSQFTLVVFALVLARALRDALYLSRTGVESLPLTYVAVGLITPLGISFYIWGLRRLRPLRISVRVQLIAASPFLIIPYLTSVVGDAIYPFLYCWVELFTAITVVLLWNIANDEFHPRQAKRLYGLIAAGQATGNVLAGLAASVLTAYIAPINMLYFVGGVSLAVGVGYFYFRKYSRANPAFADDHQPTAGGYSELTSAHFRYIIILLSMVLIIYMAASLVDFQFKVIANRHFNEAELVNFFGVFYGLSGLITFIIQVFLFRTATEKIGLFRTLSVMPALFLIFGLLLPFYPIMLISSSLKFAENGLRYSVFDPLFQTLYLPLPRSVRARVQALGGGIFKPMAIGLAGLLLAPLGMEAVDGLAAENLGYIVAALAGSTIFMIYFVRWGYIRVLVNQTAAIINPKYTGVSTFSAEEIAQVGRNFDRAGDKILSFFFSRLSAGDLPEKYDLYRRAIGRLDLSMFLRTKLLVELIEAKQTEGLAEILGDTFLKEFYDVGVGAKNWRTLIRYLDVRSSEVQAAVMWFFLKSGDPEAILQARDSLYIFMDGRRNSDREVSMLMIEFLTEAEKRRVIGHCLGWDSSRIVAQALTLLQRNPDPHFALEIFGLITGGIMPTDAARALAAMGEEGYRGVMETVEIERQTGFNRAPIWRRMGPAWSIYASFAVGAPWGEICRSLTINEPDPEFWAPAFFALAANRPARTPYSVETVEASRQAVLDWTGVSNRLAGTNGGPAMKLLRRAAERRVRSSTRAMLSGVFYLAHDPVENWQSLVFTDIISDAGARSNLAEIVDQSAPKMIKSQILSVLEPNEQQAGDIGLLGNLDSPLPALLDLHERVQSHTEAPILSENLQRILLLSEAKPFARLSAEELAVVASVLELRCYKQGGVITEKESDQSCLMLISEGEARRQNGGGEPITIGPGAMIGKPPLATDEVVGEIECLSDISAYCLSKKDFDRLLTTSPHLAQALIKSLLFD